MAIILPLLPFYSERMGASAFVVGLLVASYAACQLIAGPILGQISDRIGRKPVLIVSQVGTLIGFLILAKAQVLWVVFLSRIIDGATAGNLSLAQAYISDVTKPEERSKSFALIGIAFGIGFLIGPAISGFLSTFGYSAPVYAAAALSFTSILCTWFLLPAREPSPSGSQAPNLQPVPIRRVLSPSGSQPLSSAILLLRLLLCHVHQRIRPVHATPLQLRPERGWVSLCVGRLPGNHPARRPDRTFGQTVRRT